MRRLGGWGLGGIRSGLESAVVVSRIGLEKSFMSWEERVDSCRVGPCKAGNRITWY